MVAGPIDSTLHAGGHMLRDFTDTPPFPQHTSPLFY